MLLRLASWFDVSIIGNTYAIRSESERDEYICFRWLFALVLTIRWRYSKMHKKRVIVIVFYETLCATCTDKNSQATILYSIVLPILWIFRRKKIFQLTFVRRMIHIKIEMNTFEPLTKKLQSVASNAFGTRIHFLVAISTERYVNWYESRYMICNFFVYAVCFVQIWDSSICSLIREVLHLFTNLAIPSERLY